MAESTVDRLRRRIEDARDECRRSAEKGIYDADDVDVCIEHLREAISEAERARALGEFAIGEGWLDE